MSAVTLAPPPPPEARAVFGDRLALAATYAEWLCGVGIERGVLGPSERERIWTRHLVNSAVVARLIPVGATVVDLGSGAGLPGIPLGLARPDLLITLIEPMQRRADFARQCIAALGLDITVVRARAEDSPIRGDVVVARAVAPLARLLGLAAHVLQPGGRVIAIKGAGAPREVAAAAGALSRWPEHRVSIETLTSGTATTFAVVVETAARHG